jgi:hypothetical protein
MGLKPISTKTLEMLEKQCGRAYPLDRSGEFAAARDKRQIEILDVQKKNPLPKAD